MEQIKSQAFSKYRLVLFLVFLVAGISAYFLLSHSSGWEVSLIKDKNPPYSVVFKRNIENVYSLYITNEANEDREFAVTVIGLDGSKLMIKDTHNNPLIPSELEVTANSKVEFRLHLVGLPDVQKKRDIQINIQNLETGQTVSQNTVFVTSQ